MIYSYLKIIHIISACLLFGTGLGTASYMFFAHRTKNIAIIAPTYKFIVRGDWYFTLTSGVVQLLTGLLMVIHRSIPFTDFWVWGSLLGYIVAAACWFPVVYLQIQLRDLTNNVLKTKQMLPKDYYKKFNWWFALGWPAFLGLVVVFYLMINRPSQIPFF